MSASLSHFLHSPFSSTFLKFECTFEGVNGRWKAGLVCIEGKEPRKGWYVWLPLINSLILL